LPYFGLITLSKQSVNLLSSYFEHFTDEYNYVGMDFKGVLTSYADKFYSI